MTLGQRVAVLKDGILQQVDSPQNLYMHPANLFVGAFIGSPPMNLVEAQVSPGRVSFAGYDIALPPGYDLPGYAGKTVILGIRPSDMEDVAVWRNDQLPTINVVAEVTEELGSEVNVIFTVDAPPVLTEDTIKAASDEGEADNMSYWRTRSSWRASAHGSTRGQRGTGDRSRCPSTPRFHYFDPATGASIEVERAVPAGSDAGAPARRRAVDDGVVGGFGRTVLDGRHLCSRGRAAI
jgi:multiple sugar transport system ATP-binding protein